MEGEAISATIQVLVQNLINVSKEEISLVRSLDENADTLRGTFAIIQSSLEDAQTKSITDAAVKTWLKELEAKVFDADNALDELNYQLLSKNVPSCFSSFDRYVHRRDLALRINQINTSFDSINKRAMELGLQQKLAAAPAAASDAARETDSFTVDPIFIGRDDDVLNIVEKLTTPTEEAVSILPIVGMGGLGKTTLARKVFNHEKTKTHFGLHIWVHVSRDFDAVALLKKILKNVKGGKNVDESREGLLKRLQEASVAQNDEEVILLKNKLKILEGGNVEDESREVVMKKIQEALKGKTYLLVLDDDWNEEPLKWEDFKNSWLGITSTKGNGIIVTTRNEEVGSLVKTLDMHMLNLNGLSEDQCWSIIKDKAFERGPVSPNLEDIGKRIAERCRGLPLAANMVGGVLRGKSQDEWRLIEENWVSDVGGDDNDISRILKLSFHNLPSPSLKKCFAYCSIFPKGSRIDMQQLIELWMAEGFLQPSHQTSDMEIIGNQYLKVLLQNSLLQVVDRNKYGDVEHCSMHDLVHDVAASILDGIYYKRDESSRIPKEQAKWYICWGSNVDESSRIPKAEAKCLRTLIYNGRISDLVFSDFKSLHSLTLTDDHVRELPDSISELIHLRCLDISDTSIRYLPNSIGKLYHLQTIRHLRRYSCLRKLPSTLKNLFNLRHLYLADHNIILPPEMGKLTYLQTLPFFKVRDKKGHRIEELGSLKNLKGELVIYNLEKVQGEEGSKKACLIQKSGIVRLVLNWYGGRKGKTNDDENVLKGLQPHPNIKMFEIGGFKGACFPSWCLKMEGLSNLMEIRLDYCSECEEIPTLGHLPHLKSLYLESLYKVKSIGASFYGIEECSSNIGVRKETISVFPALERLVLENMWNLREWEEVKIPSGAQVKVFPCLEYLSIKSCRQLRSAPSQFTSLKELDIKWMESELPLASICGIKLKTLTKLRIERIKGLISLPEWLFHNNQHLSELGIDDCPKLRELPDGMHGHNSLEELTLVGCHNLRPVNGGKLQGLTSLRRLSIDAGNSGGWDSVSSFNKAVDGILRSLSHSLRELYLRGTWYCESLPDGIQHLTSLSSLTLHYFEIKELPEWFGDLTSLQELHVINCGNLKHLPSVEAMRRLTKLTVLEISGCPLLRMRCRQKSDEDSEWPKISHIIPNITINFVTIPTGGR